MVAKDCDELFGFARLAPAILRPLRRMRGVSSPKMADRMHLSARAYQDFENGRTGLLLPRICLFAKLLGVDQGAVFTAFMLGKPQIALKFAQNKFQLIQASALDELDDETIEALSAVDPLTVLDAHLKLYEDLARRGRAQLRVAGRLHGEDPEA